MGVDRASAVRLGLKVLVGLGLLPAQALSQGPMAPGGSVAPPAVRVGPPAAPSVPPIVPNAPTFVPSSPVMAPQQPVKPITPTTTVDAPRPGNAGRAVGSPGSGVPLRWSTATPLSGVSAGWSGPSGQGRLVTDDKGVLALGALSPGAYTITFDTSGVAPNQPSPKLLIGLLLPAVQKVRTVSKSMTPGLKGRLKIEVGSNGEAKTIRSIRADGGEDSASSEEDAAAFAASGRGIRLVFAVASSANNLRR